MTKPNENFKLDTDDIEMIEKSLIRQIALAEDINEVRQIRDLLGSLHNQKTWYRPNKIYVSG